MILNRDMYGKMDKPSEPIEGGPVNMFCERCGSQFMAEKLHKEVFTQSMFFGRMKDGTLTPATPKDKILFRLCTGCYELFLSWLSKE